MYPCHKACCYLSSIWGTDVDWNKKWGKPTLVSGAIVLSLARPLAAIRYVRLRESYAAKVSGFDLDC